MTVGRILQQKFKVKQMRKGIGGKAVRRKTRPKVTYWEK